MASIRLTDRQCRTEFFHKTILINLTYWLDWLAEVEDSKLEILHHDRNAIIRAISYALNLEEKAWLPAYQLLITFSPYIERGGQWEIWSKVVTEAIDLAAKLGDTSAVAHLSITLARLSLWQDRFRETITYYRRAINAARLVKNRLIEARACSNLGYSYTEHGYWYRAETLCCHALALFKEIDYQHGLAHTENHLGILYIWRCRWRQAEYHLNRACDIWQDMVDNNGLMYGLTNLGLLSVKTNQPQQALLHLKEALRWAKATGETYRLGNIYLNIGLACNLQGNFEEAEKFTRQAQIIFQQHSNLAGLMHALENLGIIYQSQQDWHKAIQYLKRALAGWRRLNKKQDELQTVVHLATCELRRGDQQQATLWINTGQRLCKQYPHSRRYYQLPEQLKNVSRNLGMAI